MANIGYIRVSSQDQNLDRQLEMMSEQNIDKLFQEKISGKDTQRPEFQKLLSISVKVTRSSSPLLID